jgi:nucleotide-binding universal stress UspA family protein
MHTPLNKILLAAYGSEGTEFAAQTAIRLANSADCELHLVYVVQVPGYPAYAPLSAQHLEWELHEGAERAGLETLGVGQKRKDHRWDRGRSAPQDRRGGGRSGWLGRGVGDRPDRRGHSG